MGLLIQNLLADTLLLLTLLLWADCISELRWCTESNSKDLTLLSTLNWPTVLVAEYFSSAKNYVFPLHTSHLEHA